MPATNQHTYGQMVRGDRAKHEAIFSGWEASQKLLPLRIRVRDCWEGNTRKKSKNDSQQYQFSRNQRSNYSFARLEKRKALKAEHSSEPSPPLSPRLKRSLPVAKPPTKKINTVRYESEDPEDSSPNSSDGHRSESPEPEDYVRPSKRRRSDSVRRTGAVTKSINVTVSTSRNKIEALASNMHALDGTVESPLTNHPNLRVQRYLASIRPSLASLGDVDVNAQKQEWRMNVLVDLLSAINEAGANTSIVRKVLLNTMQLNKVDSQLRDCLFEAFEVCIGLR